MDQKEFEQLLENRITSEFLGMSDRYMQHLWCDWVCLTAFLLDATTPHAYGFAYLGLHGRLEEWRVELLFPCRYPSQEEIPWEELLPASNVTKWMAVDLQAKRLQIEPAAAVPDLK